MKKFIKLISITLALVILLLGAGLFISTGHSRAAETKTSPGTLVAAQDTKAAPENPADSAEEPAADKEEKVDKADSSTTTGKAVSAAIVIGLAAIGGTFSMGMAISKSSDSVARQPEAGGQIQTLLMLGLVFIETVVIYALIVAILIIFVL